MSVSYIFVLNTKNIFFLCDTSLKTTFNDFVLRKKSNEKTFPFQTDKQKEEENINYTFFVPEASEEKFCGLLW